MFTELLLFDLPGGKYSKMAFDSSVKTLYSCNFNLNVNISEIEVMKSA